MGICHAFYIYTEIFLSIRKICKCHHIIAVASRIGIVLKRRDEYDAYNLHLADGTAAGQVVMHAHMHVVPRGVEDNFRWNWRQLTYPDGKAAELAKELQEKITAALAAGEDE